MSLSTSTPAPKLSLPEFSLAGRTYIVTGGARGLALTQAEAILEAGGRVYVLDVLEEPSPNFKVIATRAKDELGTSLQYIRADVQDTDALNKIVEDIVSKEGRIDGLVAAAAILQLHSALDYPAGDANKLLGINVTGVFMSAQAVARQMVKLGQGGSIVLIGSMSGSIANQGLTSTGYNISKAAVVQLARSLAVEWGQHGIRVNTISPGYIMTEQVEMLLKMDPGRRAEWEAQNPLGRISSPREYRGATIFLLSDASSYMTGSDLIMDGGHRAW